MSSSYETVIGLEIHVQLKTKSKAFCADSTLFGSPPNTQVSPVSLGHPGTLPVLNTRQVAFAVRLGLALNCTIHRYNCFDRKNYFYADLPKGYQITQDYIPICTEGYLDIMVNDQPKRIRINRIHMEEDAGKSIHDLSHLHSYIDLNRAGTPLLEVVTEPDLRSPEEVHALLSEMRRLVRYLDISDGNMEEGSMRCDCNISLRPFGQEAYGTRCEIKNVNSIRNAQRAIRYEVKRQSRILENGGEIDQETRSFNADTGDTNTVLRSKENAPDYRYFPDPDLPPVVITEEYLKRIKAEMPALPWERREKFEQEYGLSAYLAQLLTEEKAFANYFEQMLTFSVKPKSAANWLVNSVRSAMNETGMSIVDFPISPKALVNMIQLVENGKVNKLLATQRLFPAMMEAPDKQPNDLATALGLIQESGDDQLTPLVEQALQQYPGKVEAYRRGKKKLMGLFMGEVMRLSKGKANPQTIRKLLQERLDK